MNSKNIGPIIHRLFQRSAVALVVAAVFIVILAAKNIFTSAAETRRSTVEQLKRDQVTLGQKRDELEKAKAGAQSEFASFKEALMKQHASLKLEIEKAKDAVAAIRKRASEEIEKARDEFTKAQEAILRTVDVLKQEVDRARAAAEKAEQLYEEGSYWVAWITRWGKSWEEYLRQIDREKVAREKAKNDAKATLTEALEKYNQLKDGAQKSVEEAQNKFDQRKKAEEQSLRSEEEKASRAEETERKKASEIEQHTSDFEKNLEGIEDEKQKVESSLLAIERALAAVPWWQQGEYEVRSALRKHAWTIIGAALVFILPVGDWIRRLFVWFVPGAWVERRRKPLAFPEWHCAPETITTTSNQVSLEVRVKAGEVAWFRDDYLDRTTRPKGTKFGLLPIFSKRFWLMSLIDGLWWMTVIKGDSENKTNFKVSDTDDSASEFAVVEIPANSSLIIRPHFIVGLTFPADSPPKLKRHWRLMQLEAWCVGQLWFFELSGPARVVLRGARGVQLHASVDDDSIETRLNPGSLIGFSPTTKLYICRGESLWQYLANEAPFYNYSFEGNGMFLTHETQEKSPRSGPLSWLAGISDALLKLAGF